MTMARLTEVTDIDQTPDGRLWQSVRQQSQTLPLPDQDRLQSKVFRLGIKVPCVMSASVLGLAFKMVLLVDSL